VNIEKWGAGLAHHVAIKALGRYKIARPLCLDSALKLRLRIRHMRELSIAALADQALH
jgi:hypothetical protein